MYEKDWIVSPAVRIFLEGIRVLVFRLHNVMILGADFADYAERIEKIRVIRVICA